MKHRKLLGTILTGFLVNTYHAIAQDSGALVAAEAPPMHCGGFFSVVLSSGFLGVLIWAAIFLWAIALLPIGLMSIVHAATLRSTRWPLATKLLLFGSVFLFILGWLGCVQGMIGYGCIIASAHSPDISLLALHISQSLYSVSATFFLIHLYLTVFLLSFVIIHFKLKQMERGS